MDSKACVRPNYPKVYREFEGKLVRKDGKKRKYWIQDLTEEFFEEVVSGYTKGFLLDEPLCKYTKCSEDELCVQEFADMWRYLLSEKISLICLTKDEQGKTRICGYNCLYSALPDEEEDEMKSPATRRVISLLKYVSGLKDPFKTLNIDRYLSAMGLYVLPEFRGEGLGQVILDTRQVIGRELGYKASLTAYTSFISQKQAERAGFKEYVTISYDDLAKVNKDFEMPGIQEHTKILRFMYMSYE